MNKLLILGAGGNSKVIAENALSSKFFDEIQCLDDNFERNKKNYKFSKLDIVGPLESIYDKKIKNKFTYAVVSISDHKIRSKWINYLEKESYQLKPIIHESAYVSKSSKIGNGTIVYPKACIQSESIIGKGVFLNTNCCVEHDSFINDFVHICPGSNLGGDVKIGKGSWVGIGSSIIQGIDIGKEVFIGAGSVVIRNLPNGVKAVGNPAQII